MFVYYYFLLLSAEDSVITGCEGSRIYGSNIYIDFNAISSPCICIVLPSFAGKLLITTSAVPSNCDSRIYVKTYNTTFKYDCLLSSFLTQTITVNINQSVEVRAEYVSPYTLRTFYHCFGFQQNGKYVNMHIETIIFTMNTVFLMQLLFQCFNHKI